MIFSMNKQEIAIFRCSWADMTVEPWRLVIRFLRSVSTPPASAVAAESSPSEGLRTPESISFYQRTLCDESCKLNRYLQRGGVDDLLNKLPESLSTYAFFGES